jgi:iron complex transport system substrate-binding protein
MVSRRALLWAIAASGGAANATGASAQSPTRRIVSVGGDVTEILFALGLGPEIVGVDSTSLFPSDARTRPKVGYLRSLASEGIVSLRPTHLAANADAGPLATLDQLRAVGVKVFEAPVSRTPADVAAKIRFFADVFSVADGEIAATRFERNMARVQNEVAALRDRPKVVFLISINAGSPSAAGRDTAADAIIKLAGAINPITAYTGYRALSLESAVIAQPDVVLMMEHALTAAGGIDAVAQNPAIALTPAGQRRRIFGIDGNLMLGFGPRLPEGVSTLSRLVRSQA